MIDKNMEELKNCGFVKTVLMLFVVFYHSILFWKGDWFLENPVYTSDLLRVLSKFINTFHISGFTLVSGYIFGYVYFEKQGYSDAREFIKKKIRRLLIPYICVASFWVIPISLIFFKYSVIDIIDKYFLGTSPSQLWFLLMLFNVFLISYMILSIIKRRVYLGILLSIILYALGLIGKRIIPDFFQIFNALQFFTFFMIGVSIRYYRKKINMKPVYVLILFFIYVSLFTVNCIIEKNEGIINDILRKGLDYVICILGAIESFYIFQIFSRKINNNNALVKCLSKYSMSIYLLHQQLIYITIYLLNGKINPYIHSIVNYMFAMIMSISISAFLFKFKTTRHMIGEK